MQPNKDDALSRLKAEYLDAGNQRDKLFWGWIQNRKSGVSVICQ